jgi:hypothetical protein
MTLSDANKLRLGTLVGVGVVAFAATSLERPWKARVGYSGLLFVMLCAALGLVLSLRQGKRAVDEIRRKRQRDGLGK